MPAIGGTGEASVRLRHIVCALALGATLGAGSAWAASVTGTGSAPSQKEACDEARANAKSQVPAGAKITKYSDCLCRGRATKSCTISAEY